MLGLGLGLTSSLCWGISDFIGGLSARRLHLLFVMISSQAVGLAVVICVVAIRGTGVPELVRLLPAVGGGLAGIAALTSFYRALAIGLGERVRRVQELGIAAALTGVVLMAAG